MSTSSFTFNYKVLSGTNLKTLPLWMMGTTTKEIKIAGTHEDHATTELSSFTSYISERNYKDAVRHMEAYLDSSTVEASRKAYPIHLFSLCMAGQKEKAERMARRSHRY